MCHFDAHPKRTVEEELEGMEMCDFDAGSARLVGTARQIGGRVQGNFISPYWEAASRKALVDCIVQTHSPKPPALAASRKDFDDAVDQVMNGTPTGHPNLKPCLTEAMRQLLVSDAARRSFVDWYDGFHDNFADMWVDDPDKFGIAEDALACLVEEIRSATGSSSVEPFVATTASTGPIEPLIPIEQPYKWSGDPVVAPPEANVILTFKMEQLVPCNPYFELRVPKENDVKSMFRGTKDVKGQRWRTARLQSAMAIPKELVCLVMEVPKSSFVVAARDHECIVFYSEDKDVRAGFQVTSGMLAILGDLKVDHWSFLHPHWHKQNVMDAVHQIVDWGTMVAGNMKVQSIKQPTARGSLLSFKECQMELSKLSLGSFQEFVADSKLAQKQGKASPLQQSVLVIQKELGQWKSSSAIFDIKEGPVYPDGFLKDHKHLMGYQIVSGSKKPVQISLTDHMYTSACVQKSAFFVGKQGGGKSSIAQALGRLCAVRCGRSKILYSKSFDNVGELTRSGLVKQIGGFVFSDFCWVSLINTRLMHEDIMAILDVAEPASFKCRYHVGVMEKRVPRFFCANAGTYADGSMDHGAWFDEDMLGVLGALARGADLGKFPDNELALARRVVIFPITTDDDIALDVKTESTKKEDDFELLLEAERLYREQVDE